MKKIKKYNLKWIIFLVVLIHILFLLFKPLPIGVSYVGEMHYISEENVYFLYDITYNGSYNQSIFPTLFSYMDDSESFLFAGMFLMSMNYASNDDFLNITDEFFDRMSESPGQRVLITDPINTFYGSHDFQLALEAESMGVEVYYTDFYRLRPSNIVWSSVYYPFLMWIPTRGNGLIPHPFGDPDQKVTVRSMLSLLNFQANHRKVAVMDSDDTYASFILSANPHNPSSLHSNIGFLIKDEVFAAELLYTETALISFSHPLQGTSVESMQTGSIGVQLLTEGAILDAIVRDIDATVAGDTIEMAMFYFSERRIVRALKRASDRGVMIEIILDPNKDAFGREKNGIPNRQVAWELESYSDNIRVRWYDTQGEQFHSKLLVITTSDSKIVHGGSANFTRRNIGNYNLETNVRLIVPFGSELYNQFVTYFEIIEDFVLPFSAYEDTSRWKYWLYRFQEWSGLGTF